MVQGSSYINRLLGLLRGQARGQIFAARKIRALVRPFTQSDDSWFSHPDLTKSQSQCIGILYREWEGMFSYRPGRVEGLGPLLELLQWVENDPSADPSSLHQQSAWKKIEELASPAEAVTVMKCVQCGQKYPMIGTSGFMDINGFVCADCGHALFRSMHDHRALPRCRCGGKFFDFCPHCGSKNYKVKKEMSPYEYFARHGFSWDSEPQK